MTAQVEQEPKPQAPLPKEIEERAEELPPEVEAIEAGVQTTQVQPSTQVPTDDSGKPLVQSQTTQALTVNIPAAQQQLSDWSKGSPAQSLTWFATFWLRIIKKALHFGWKIVTRGRS